MQSIQQNTIATCPPVYSFLMGSYTTETGSKKGPLELYVVEPQLLLPGGSPQVCTCAGQLLAPVCAYLRSQEQRGRDAGVWEISCSASCKCGQESASGGVWLATPTATQRPHLPLTLHVATTSLHGQHSASRSEVSWGCSWGHLARTHAVLSGAAGALRHSQDVAGRRKDDARQRVLLRAEDGRLRLAKRHGWRRRRRRAGRRRARAGRRRRAGRPEETTRRKDEGSRIAILSCPGLDWCLAWQSVQCIRPPGIHTTGHHPPTQPATCPRSSWQLHAHLGLGGGLGLPHAWERSGHVGRQYLLLDCGGPAVNPTVTDPLCWPLTMEVAGTEVSAGAGKAKAACIEGGNQGGTLVGLVGLGSRKVGVPCSRFPALASRCKCLTWAMAAGGEAVGKDCREAGQGRAGGKRCQPEGHHVHVQQRLFSAANPNIFSTPITCTHLGGGGEGEGGRGGLGGGGDGLCRDQQASGFR